MTKLASLEEPASALVVYGGGGGFALKASGGLSLLAAPPTLDCTVEELLKIGDSLPENFGLLFDRQSTHLRVLQVLHASSAKVEERGVIQRPTTPNVNYEHGGEVAHAHSREAHPRSRGAEVFDETVVAHGAVLAVWRFA
jgi:hypothetical protein